MIWKKWTSIIFVWVVGTSKIHGALMSMRGELLPVTVVECIVNLINVYLNETVKIAVAHEDEDKQNMILAQLFQRIPNPITVNANEEHLGAKLDLRTPSGANIILSETIDLASHLSRNRYVATTVFILVSWKNTTAVENPFRMFWNYNVVNAYVLEVVGNDKIDVYYYKPFVNCGVSKPIYLDSWSNGKFLFGGVDRLKDRLPVQDAQGCTLVVTGVDAPPNFLFPTVESRRGTTDADGIEVRLLKEVAKMINSSFIFKLADDGGRWGLIDPIPNGAVGEVFNRKSHFACGIPSPTIDRMSYLDCIVGTSLRDECVAFFAPSGAAIEQSVWITVYIDEFSSMVWLFLLITLLITAITWYLIDKLLNERGESLGLTKSFLFLYSSLFGNTVSVPLTITLKFVLILWFWYGVVLQVAYESSMKSKLSAPVLHKDVDTLRDMLDTNLELWGVSDTVKVLFRNNTDTEMCAIASRTKVSNLEMEDIAEKMIKQRNFFYMREETTFQYVANQKRENLGKIHKIGYCPYPYYPALYLQRRSPFTEMVQYYIGIFVHSGLVKYWRDLFMHDVEKNKPQFTALTVEHIKGPFVAYGMGIGLSLAIFIGEVVFHRFVAGRERKLFSKNVNRDGS